MIHQEDVMPWTQPGWLEQVSHWIQSELKSNGIAMDGEIEQSHAYPWSTVLRIPTRQGIIYFKAVSPLDPHEPVLLQALARWQPECLPEILSIDTTQGWLLMRNGGPMLRNAIRPTRDMRPWFPVLPIYAGLQIEMAEHVPELLGMGVPDRRLPLLPPMYDALLADVDVLRIDQPVGLTADQYQQLKALSPRVAELCKELADYPIPETLNHGDLTDGNILEGSRGPIFIDWGDSCVSHPFYSLRTVLVSAQISLQL